MLSGHEAVAGARLRQQVARPGGVGLELPPELRHVHVQVVRLVAVGRAPHLAQDRPVGQQLPLVEREQPDDPELVRRQVHRLAGDGDGGLLEVDADRADLHDRLGRRADPPQHGAQPREQLADRERLRDVVVGAGVESGDLLVVVADRGDEDDRRLAPLAQAATHLAAGAVGQQQVEDDGVGRPQPRGRERGGGRLRRLDLVARAAQVGREGAQELRLVVDDEHVPVHETPAGRRSARKASRAQVPPPSRGRSSSVPPFAKANPWAIASPSPRPRCEDAAASTPRPRSSTSRTTSPSRAEAATSTSAVENLSALSSRFTSTRCTCTASTETGGRPSAPATRTRSRSATSATAGASRSSTSQSSSRGAAAPAWIRDRSSTFSTSRESLAAASEIVSRRSERSAAVSASSPSCSPPSAALIVAIGVRKSCETVCRITVLIASERRTASMSRRSAASASSEATPASKRACASSPASASTTSARRRSSSRGSSRSTDAAASASSAVSRSRCSASAARRRALVARWLATTAVVRYTASAVQLRASASVSVCTGGRNRKLNASIDATAAAIARPAPKNTAQTSTASTYRTPRLRTGAIGFSA